MATMGQSTAELESRLNLLESRVRYLEQTLANHVGGFPFAAVDASGNTLVAPSLASSLDGVDSSIAITHPDPDPEPSLSETNETVPSTVDQ